MVNAWDSARSLTAKHGNNGGVFVRLVNHGDKVTGVFCGEPYAREVIWTGERYQEFDPKNPAHSIDGKRPSLRVAINFFVPAEGAMKVVEGGTQWFKDLLKIRDKYGLDTWSFEIERHGEAGDPKTKYSILPDEKIDATLRSKLSAARLNDLAVLVGGETRTATGTPPTAQTAESDEIDPRTVTEFISRLKLLSRDQVTSLLADFEVARVRELRASDVGRFEIALSELERGGGVEIDPFA
jgi:hypothetical protein